MAPSSSTMASIVSGLFNVSSTPSVAGVTTTSLAMQTTAPPSYSPMILEAPDETCGYIFGVNSGPFVCLDSSNICALYFSSTTSSTTPASPPVSFLGPSSGNMTVATTTSTTSTAPTQQPGSILCCNPGDGTCTAQPTACVDAYFHPYSRLCTGSCPVDPMTRKCTTGLWLHCNRISFKTLEPSLVPRTGPAPTGPGGEALGVTDFPGAGAWICGVTPVPTTRVFVKTVSYRIITALRREVDGAEEVESAPTPTPTPAPKAHHARAFYSYIRHRSSSSSQTPLGPLTIIEGILLATSTYDGQTDRSPYAEATRNWAVFTPGLIHNLTGNAKNRTKSTTRIFGGPRDPPPPPRLNVVGLAVGLAVVAVVVGGCIAACVLSKRRKRKAAQVEAARAAKGKGRDIGRRAD